MRQTEARAAPIDGRQEARTILVSANSSWNIVNFRGGLIRALADRGYRIVVAAPDDAHGRRLAELPASFVPVPMDSSGASVLEDLVLLRNYVRIFREVSPFAYLSFTAKPNIYGSLAGRWAGAKVINNISGLGTVFIQRNFLTSIVSQLYRISLRGSSTIFFQNRDDMEMFINSGIVRPEQARLLPGSGVDLERFSPLKSPREPGPFRFLLVGRLLWDKGVAEYVEAARIVRRSFPEVSFQMLGPVGAANRTAVPSGLIERWRAEGIIDYLGERDDVRTAIGQADCIVLPSYREGLPRALLEGSAMAKPVIATDVAGCRDVVVDGETGYLCAERSAELLAAAMVKMLEMPEIERLSMGEHGRRKVEGEFCETLVVAKYLEALGTR